MDEREISKKLNEKLQCNYADFVRQWLALDPSHLIEKAEEIAATKLVYDELTGGCYGSDQEGYLLRFENPLEVVRNQWIDEQNVAHDEELNHALWSIADQGSAEQDYPLDPSYSAPDQDGGVKMC